MRSIKTSTTNQAEDTTKIAGRHAKTYVEPKYEKIIEKEDVIDVYKLAPNGESLLTHLLSS